MIIDLKSEALFYFLPDSLDCNRILELSDLLDISSKTELWGLFSVSGIFFCHYGKILYLGVKRVEFAFCIILLGF